MAKAGILCGENWYLLLDSLQQATEAINRAYSDKEKAAAFTHKILDRNGKEVATLTTALTGICSEGDRTAEFKRVSCWLSGTDATRFTYNTSMSGNTATVNLFFNSLSAGTFTYQIYANGTIQY